MLSVSSYFWIAVMFTAVFFPGNIVNAQTSWVPVRGPYTGVISSVAVNSRGVCFAADPFSGIYRSTDDGSNWANVGSGVIWSTVSSLVVDSSDYLYAASVWNGLFESGNNGATWTKSSLTSGAITGMVLRDNSICFGGFNTVSISSDKGQSWRSSNVSPWNIAVISLAEDHNGNLYAGLQVVKPRNATPYGGGVYISSDFGKSWSYFGMALDSVKGIAVGTRNNVFIATPGAVYSSAAGDSNWVINIVGLPHSEIGTLTNSSNGDVVCTIGGSAYVYDENSGAWDVVLGSGLSSSTITSIHYDPEGVSYVGTTRQGLFEMTDPKKGWVQCGVSQASVSSVNFGLSGTLLAGTEDGIYLPVSNTGFWKMESDGLSGGKVYSVDTLNGSSGMLAATSGGIFYSGDSGTSWLERSQWWTYDITQGYAGTLYAGTSSGVLVSTDGGYNWSHLANIGFPISTVYSVFARYSQVFAGTSNNGVFLTTDGGSFWTQTGISSPLMFHSVRALAQRTLIFKTDSTVYTSFSGPIYAGTDSSGVFLTTDISSDDWTHVAGITVSSIGSFYFLPETPSLYPYQNQKISPMFVATHDGGVFVSTDEGQTLGTMNNGLLSLNVSSLAMDQQGILYAATDSGIFRTVGPVTAVSTPLQEPPRSFSLSQNYPNPFNPTTKIEYALSSKQYVELSVFDVLGRKVATLVNQFQNPGDYSIEFDGTKFPSGVYFYRLESGPNVITRKMALIK